MADKAVANITTRVMSDFAKMSMAGSLNFTPVNTGDKWIYLETIVDASSVALIQAGVMYNERYVRADGSETFTATGDFLRWCCIKHTGTTDGSTATTSGIVVSLDGSGNAAYQESEGFFIDTGEMFCFKPSYTTLNDIGAISVTVSNGMPISPSSPGDVLILLAAIVDDQS